MYIYIIRCGDETLQWPKIKYIIWASLCKYSMIILKTSMLPLDDL